MRKNTTNEDMIDIENNPNVDASNIEISSENDYKNSLETPEVSSEPIETFDNETEGDILKAMQYLAIQSATNSKEDGFNITVSDIMQYRHNGAPQFFFIECEDKNKSYVVYKFDSEIYFRPLKEWLQIYQDIRDHVPGVSEKSLKYEYNHKEEPLDSYNVGQRDDCLFIIDSIFSSICGKSYTNDAIISGNVNESIKIRKHNKLGTDGIAKNSKKFHDAKYGTPEENAFKQEIEDKQKKDGTMGALDQQQQESAEPVFKMKLPNVHNISEMNENMNVRAILEAQDNDIVYEPLDRVVVKINGQELKGSVVNAYDNTDGSQVVVVMVQGHTINFTSNEVKPDRDYLLNTRWGNCVDNGEMKALDLDPKTRLNNRVENDKTDYSKDYKNLNDRVIECDIVVDGFKLNWQKQYADLQDIMESKNYIRVMNESGEVNVYDADNLVFDAEDWPWAVVVEDGDAIEDDKAEEPIRKIRINPTAYIEAEDDDMVDCLVNGEKTEMIKKNIKIIS